MKAVLIGCFALSALTAAADPAERLVERLTAYRSFSSGFVQETEAPDGRLLDARVGRFDVGGPRLFSWETESPFAQRIVADGDALWVYDPDLAQVTVRPLDEAMLDSPLTVLASDAEALRARYTVSRVVLEVGERFILEPIARDQMVSVIDLVFREDALMSLGVKDGLGQTTQIKLTETQPLAATTEFEFVVPEGVDLIDGR